MLTFLGFGCFFLMNFIRVFPLHFCWTHIGTLTQLFKNIIFIYLWLSVFMIIFPEGSQHLTL